MYLPLFDIATQPTDFYSLLLKTNLVYVVLASHTTKDGLLPISPVTTRPLLRLESKQVTSLL